VELLVFRTRIGAQIDRMLKQERKLKQLVIIFSKAPKVFSSKKLKLITTDLKSNNKLVDIYDQIYK
jgi:hypothetical protein